MTRRKDRAGRPSIGQPAPVWGRVTVEVREQVELLAEQHDVSRARVVAALIDVGLANLDQARFPVKQKSQEELPLSDAS